MQSIFVTGPISTMLLNFYHALFVIKYIASYTVGAAYIPNLCNLLSLKGYCQKQLNVAKDSGLTITLRHAKVMVCGAAKAGKTHFTHFLRKKKYEGYRSTGVSETKQVVVKQLEKQKINICGTEWTDLDKKLEHQEVIERLLSKLNMEEVEPDSKSNNESDTKSNAKLNETNDSQPPNVPTSQPAYQLVNKPDNQLINKQPSNNQNLSNILSLTKPSPEEGIDNEHKVEIFSTSDTTMQHEMVVDSEKNMTNTEYVTIRKNVLAGKHDKTLEKWDMITLLDTGGQPELMNMLPSVNTSAAVNFIVFDLSIGSKDDLSNGISCLKEYVEAQSSKEGYTKRKLNYTYLDLLKCLLSFTKISARKKILYPELSSFNINKKCYDKSGVCFIGTHADELIRNLFKSEIERMQNQEIEINESDRENDQDNVDFFSKEFNLLLEGLVRDEVDESLDNDKVKLLVKKRFNNYVNDVNQEIRVLIDQIEQDKTFGIWNAGGKNLFVVDNTTAGQPQDDKHVAEKIRSEIFKTVKETWYEIPVAWFVLQLQLSYEEDVFIPLGGVKALCDKIMPKGQEIKKSVIRDILRFFHTLGTLMYFGKEVGDFVITNPQWLFDALTEIVDCICSDTIHKNLEAVNAFKYRGILSDDLLDGIDHLAINKICLSTNTNSDDCKKEKRELFLKLLEHLKIIAPWPTDIGQSKDEKNQCYFMPSILPNCKLINDMDKILPESEFGKPVSLKEDGIVEPLLIKFTYGTIPRGFLCFLAVTLLKKQENWALYPSKDRDLHQFSNLIKLRVGIFEYLALIDRTFYLELQVRVNHEDVDKNPCNICFEIQEAVTSALQDICKDFNSQFNDLRYGFLCRKCLQNPENHLTVLFKDKPISEYIPDNHCAGCDKKATKLQDKHDVWFKVCSLYVAI